MILTKKVLEFHEYYVMSRTCFVAEFHADEKINKSELFKLSELFDFITVAIDFSESRNLSVKKIFSLSLFKCTEVFNQR